LACSTSYAARSLVSPDPHERLLVERDELARLGPQRAHLDEEPCADATTCARWCSGTSAGSTRPPSRHCIVYATISIGRGARSVENVAGHQASYAQGWPELRAFLVALAPA